METASRKVKIALTCGLLATASVLAQDSEPSSSPAVPPSASPTPGSSPAENAKQNSAADYLFNKAPADGSAAKETADISAKLKDKIIAQDALGLDRFKDEETRARFFKFLGTPEVAADRLTTYAAIYDKARGFLRERRLPEAWRALHLMAEYEEIDAGVSRELANRIETIWGVNRSSEAIKKENSQLQQDAKSAARNADTMSTAIRDKDIEYYRRMNGGNTRKNNNSGGPNGGVPQVNQGNVDVPSAPNVDSMLGKMALTEEYLRGLEIKAKIKMNELKAQKHFDQAKTDFADYVTTLYESGRHRHVILGSEFYLRLFDQTDYPVAMAQQVNAALEKEREVRSAVDVFNYKLERKDLVAASDRLQEAFLLSEYHPAVLALERSKKERIEDLNTRFERIRNMIEARDFGALEIALSELKGLAGDFDATKATAIVNGIKLESRLRLGKAKIAAQQGNMELAMQEFQKAAETWPGNPELEKKANDFFVDQDLVTQSLTEFDRMVTEGNVRGIFEKQLAFAPAMKDDAKRQEQLKAALEKVKAAEMAIEKANTLRNNGDVYGAWETVELAVVDFPTDTKLNMLRGELAGKGAEFVAALNRAKEAEARNEWGYSLSWYAVAQRQYPNSQMANKAIDRLSKQILEGSM